MTAHQVFFNLGTISPAPRTVVHEEFNTDLNMDMEGGEAQALTGMREGELVVCQFCKPKTEGSLGFSKENSTFKCLNSCMIL